MNRLDYFFGQAFAGVCNGLNMEVVDTYKLKGLVSKAWEVASLMEEERVKNAGDSEADELRELVDELGSRLDRAERILRGLSRFSRGLSISLRDVSLQFGDEFKEFGISMQEIEGTGEHSK